MAFSRDSHPLLPGVARCGVWTGHNLCEAAAGSHPHLSDSEGTGRGPLPSAAVLASGLIPSRQD